MYFKNDHPLTTTYYETYLHCRKPAFYLVNILLDDFVLLRKVKFRCPHIESGALLRQVHLIGSPGVNLIQTDAGFLCKFFVSDARALQSGEHPHCFVLYSHLFILHLFYFCHYFCQHFCCAFTLLFIFAYIHLYNILLLTLQYLLFNGRANPRAVLSQLFLHFAVCSDHCIHFLLKWFVKKQSPVAYNAPHPQILDCKI